MAINRLYESRDASEMGRMFTETFTASEGEEEGRLIERLTRDLVLAEDGRDIVGFVAELEGRIVGGIFFSRLFFEDGPSATLLAPVAVHPDVQRQGVGQALIRYGLDEMASRGAEVAITYGDPAYYGKFGFELLSEDTVAGPFPLSLPHGWLGQSLGREPLKPIKGRPWCVAAFEDPKYW